MEFHFVKLNVNGGYLSLVDPTAKPRYVCFAERHTAEKCIDYVSSFRSRNGNWPSFDMSQPKRKISMDINKKRVTPEKVKRYMEIETLDYDSIDLIAGRTNVSFYCVLRFDTISTGDMENVSMSGTEMDGEAVLYDYVNWMNLNLKVN
jgi:hypothetical protein|uniref:Uncharacterized protein n=1 Tax=Mantoniella tinhauana virus 1 TaxID=3111543 RepID=A0AB38ZMP4_9VIRU